MKTKHLVVISFDAVSSEDIKKLKNLENFKYLINNGSLIENVESVYPTLTYPAHATIVTGKYPKNHGVVNNTLLNPFDSHPNWYWYRKYIKGDTLYDLAKNAGLSTCSLLWPVTGRSSIDFNLTEIFPTKSWHNQLIMSASSGSLKYQLELNKKFGHLRKGISQPYLDNFVQESVKYTILKYKPNLMLIHFTDVDTHRHYCGYDSKEANEALVRHNERLGEIILTLKEANIFEETTIVALGDHSAIEGDKMIKLNVLFNDNNLLEVDSNGKIKNYKAFAKSCDGSSYVYLKDKNDLDVKNKVYELISSLNTKDTTPIEFILDSNEASLAGADDTCTFMVEANKNYYFIDEAFGDVIETVNPDHVGKLPHRTKATHGYSPTKDNYGTFFIASGPGIKKDVLINKGRLINHGPTLAKLLGLTLKDTDGKVEERILNL
ncbi:ectonucleotide pyrophosphatase/phosphodiesterase [Clostridium carnis]